MKKLILLLLALTAIEGQTRRFPFRAATGGGGSGQPCGAEVYDYYSNQVKPAPLTGVSPGQGRVNQFCVCEALLTPINPPSAGNPLVGDPSYVNDYSAPNPFSPNRDWVVLLSAPYGGRFIQWLGPMSVPSWTPGSTCSIPVGTPRTLPSPPAGITNLAWQWHPGGTGDPRDEYKMYTTGHVNGSPPTNQLWALSCDPTVPANRCAFSDANWQWTLIKDFSGSDAQGPYIQFTHPAFCREITQGEKTSCGTGSQQFWDANAITLYMISTDGNKFIFSLRRETKNEHGLCEYTLSSDTFNCSYLDAYGELEGESPNLPACHKGAGGVQSRNVGSSAYWGYQMNGAARSWCLGEDAPRWYRAPKSTTRVGRFVNAVSVTGNQAVAHGSATATGFTSLSFQAHPQSPPWWGFCAAPYAGSPNYIALMRTYDVDTVAIADRIFLYLDQCGDYRGGLHAGSADVPSNWQIISTYRSAQNDTIPDLPDLQKGFSGGRIAMVDTTQDLGAFANHPTQFSHGKMRFLGYHFSRQNPNDAIVDGDTGYYLQPQAARSNFKAGLPTYVIYRSTMGGTSTSAAYIMGVRSLSETQELYAP